MDRGQQRLFECMFVQDLALLMVKRVRFLQHQSSVPTALVKAETGLALRLLERMYEMCYFARHVGSLLQANSKDNPSQLAEEFVQELDLDKFCECLYLTEHLLPCHGEGESSTMMLLLWMCGEA